MTLSKKKETGPQTCDICSTEFANAKLFKSHISDAHMIGEFFNCAFCETKFKKIKAHTKMGFEILKYHLDVKHPESSGEKKFFCTKCPKAFSYESSLRKHISAHVRQAKKHVCEICGAEFKTLNGFNMHMAKNHSIGTVS